MDGDEIKITASSSGKDAKKRKQINMNSFFSDSGVPRKKSLNVSANAKDNEKNERTKEKQIPAKRILKLTTAENWKKTFLADSMAEKWLILHSSKKRVKLPLCRVKVVLNSKRKSHHVRTINLNGHLVVVHD